MEKVIDINCDLGEGIGNDEELMPLLSSCNIACGVHAGNERIMTDTIKLAIKNSVKIGAHPSYPDRENFGRLDMQIPLKELTKIITDQINELVKIIKENGTKINHVKAHGALYNRASIDLKTANALVDAVLNFKGVKLYAPWKSVLSEVALKAGLSIKYEVFADRSYNSDLTLVSRKLPEALLHDPDLITNHVLNMIVNNKVKSVTGEEVEIMADTICIHGDNPDALMILKHLHKIFGERTIHVA